MKSPRTVITIVDSLAAVSCVEWNRLAGDDPFLSHTFLNALHESGCASAATGWQPCYVLLHEDNQLAAAMPLYLKSHSYGEYVFDWAWADAYGRHGLEYYPKLLNAVPFTPVSGKRLLAVTHEHCRLLLDAAFKLARQTQASSLHCLFPLRDQAMEMSNADMLLRQGVQFHWQNRDYADFNAFLATMNHDKRKKIKQERRHVRDAGIAFEWLNGHSISESQWEFFYHCYCETYRRHGSTPYLTLEFFKTIGTAMPDHILLVVAIHRGRSAAASLNIHNGTRLCGRYWGTLEYHPALHFETCYYQVIEFCIAHRIEIFEGGAQGAHKIARGLLPAQTYSAHWLDHPQFAAAVEQFLKRETGNIQDYVDELQEHSPFRMNL